MIVVRQIPNGKWYVTEEGWNCIGRGKTREEALTEFEELKIILAKKKESI